jgi:predicted Zn finger-like uncharacterized protein
MRITCPECGFTRNVPDDKVPATSAMATCPKCRHRFRFRELDEGDGRRAWVGEPPLSEPRLPGEGMDVPLAGKASESRGPAPGAARQNLTAEPVSHWSDPDAAFIDNTASAPKAAPSRLGTRRGFPPPSAHWEPDGAEDVPEPENAGGSAPDAPPRPPMVRTDCRWMSATGLRPAVNTASEESRGGTKRRARHLGQTAGHGRRGRVTSCSVPCGPARHVPAGCPRRRGCRGGAVSGRWRPGLRGVREQGGSPGARPEDDGGAEPDSPAERASGR